MGNNGQGMLFDLEEAGDDDVARSLLDQLLSDSKLYKWSESYKKLLEFVIRLRNVAPFNAMLLQLQKPGLTYAASARDWREEFTRGIKEDARPLIILWPFGPVATVFDVLDTYDLSNPESETLPEELSAFFASGKISETEIAGFIPKLEKKGIDWKWFDKGDADAGRMQKLVVEEDSAKKNDTTKKQNARPRYRVKINKNHSAAVQFTTLAHELAHLCLGHLGPDKTLNIPRRRPLRHSEVEIEAETTAFLICERNGIRSKSESYLANFVDTEFKAENIDLYQVMRAAGQVETLLDLTTHTKFDKPKKAGNDTADAVKRDTEANEQASVMLGN